MSLNGLARLAPLDWFSMGRVTPDAPRQLQGPPKPDPKPMRPLHPEQPIGHGPFQCRYCKRYGQPGACAGCGAPNAPVEHKLPARQPDTIHRMVDAGMLTPNEARRYLDISTHDKPGQYLCVPAFPMVKR
jgi:hypothetical protein